MSSRSPRAEKLIANSEGLDVIVVFNGVSPYLDSTFWYLTELESGSFESSLAIVTRDGNLHVAVSPLEAEIAMAGKGEKHVFTDADSRETTIAGLLAGKKKIGVNFQKISYAAVKYIQKIVPRAELIDASDFFSKTTNVKDAKEIKAIEEACSITSKVAAEIPDMLREGMTEREMAASIDGAMRSLGADSNAFDTIAAFGPNSSQPHYMPGDRKLSEGDTALFDFGCKRSMYCSDLTRTVFFGEPPEILLRAYDVVRQAQEIGLEAVRAGAPASAPDLAARAFIDSTEFKGRFIHSFGHGIGMEVHEPIHLSPKSTQILEAGNVVSAEPGVYIEGIGGIRIEDTILVTENGFRRLTSFPKEPTIVRL